MSKCIVCFLLLSLVGSPFAEAQQPAKLNRLGMLIAGSASGESGGGELLKPELRALGYVEGKNIAFDYRHAEGKPDRLPDLADELVRLQPDVLVAASTTAALAAKNRTRTIPIVFLAAGDPVAAGLVDSLARPGGNLTGFTRIAGMSGGKRLELLKEIVPRLSRVALLWHPGNAGSEEIWKEVQLPARALGLHLYSMEVSSVQQFERAFQQAAKAPNDALAVTLSALISSNRKRIADSLLNISCHPYMSGENL